MPSRIKFDIRGARYETWDSTLARYPNTLLGSAASLKPFYDRTRGVYAINCCRDAFDAILFFYQSGGILARPAFVSESQFLNDLEFFGIINKEIQRKTAPPKSGWAGTCWTILEQPKKSTVGVVVANLSFWAIVASMLTFCAETLFVDVRELSDKERQKSVWFALESCFIAWFTVEYFVRLVVCPRKLAFFFSALGLIDMLSILPFYISLILSVLEELGLSIRVLSVVRVLRLLQIVRAVKLTRHSSGLQVLVKSLVAAKDQLSSLLILLFLAVALMSSVMFELEVDGNEAQFQSIPHTFWFGVISMTTVGYGDIVPTSTLGKICGAVTIFFGVVILFNLFIPIYLTYFAVFYRKQEKAKRLRQKYPSTKSAKPADTEASGKPPEESGALPKLLTLVVKNEILEPSRRARKLTMNVEMKKMHVLSSAAEVDSTQSDFQNSVLPFLSVPPEVQNGLKLSQQEEAEEQDMDWVIYEWQLRCSDGNEEADADENEPNDQEYGGKSLFEESVV